MNPMKEIRIEKLTLNIGAGKDVELLKKGVKLIKHITGIEPVKTITQKRIPALWWFRKCSSGSSGRKYAYTYGHDWYQR